MNDRRNQIIEMRRQGLTYREIGEVFGFSRERARFLASQQEPSTYFRPASVVKIPYVGLREWMMENKISRAELRRRTGVSNLLVNGECEIKAKNVAKILEVTGMTFEECFRRD